MRKKLDYWEKELGRLYQLVYNIQKQCCLDINRAEILIERAKTEIEKYNGIDEFVVSIKYILSYYYDDYEDYGDKEEVILCLSQEDLDKFGTELTTDNLRAYWIKYLEDNENTVVIDDYLPLCKDFSLVTRVETNIRNVHPEYTMELQDIPFDIKQLQE